MRATDVHVVLDLIERGFMVALFLNLSIRILMHLSGAWFVDICLLISEAIATGFLLTHYRTKDASVSVGDWIVTLVACAMPTLVIPSDTPNVIPLSACAALLAVGFVLQFSAKLTLRRSFGLTPANRGVKTSGPYRFLRHPMYAGYVLIQMAFLGAHPNFWNLAIYTLAFGAQVYRLLAEERLLSADPTYRSFMQTTRYRLLPFVF